MECVDNVEQCVDGILERTHGKVVLGVPLGLGKPVQLINALYQRVKADAALSLRIITALSLEKPKARSDMEARFLEPILERLFGGYEELDYMLDLRRNAVPTNIEISEFYFKAGAMKKLASAQQNYISTNYTFVPRELILNDVNVVAQLVAEGAYNGQPMLSLSCNADITPDLMPLIAQLKAQGREILTVAQVHGDLPFMVNDALIDEQSFDWVIRNDAYNTPLFAPPNLSVSVQDYATGLHAASLIKDGGTLQIGIGSLSDSIVAMTRLRNESNDQFCALLHDLIGSDSTSTVEREVSPFEKGLYGCSEMFVNGFRFLIDAGIVKRSVVNHLVLQQLMNAGQLCDEAGRLSADSLNALRNVGMIGEPLTDEQLMVLKAFGVLCDAALLKDGRVWVGDQSIENRFEGSDQLDALAQLALGDTVRGVVMHGGFFLGPKDFYQWLRDLTPERASSISMTSVGFINQIAHDPQLLQAQRQHARFINSAMMVSLDGAVCSDGLEDGTVISGVGGQYNFVAQAHQLEGARSVICIRSARGQGSERQSNIVTHYGYCTIPRHLRDIVVTEYGVADLRGKTDHEVAVALIRIADSEFQAALLEDAKARGKVRADFELEPEYCDNTPERIEQWGGRWQAEELLEPFPLGTDFTDQELAIGQSLKRIKSTMNHPLSAVRSVIKSWIHHADTDAAAPYLERMQLSDPSTPKEAVIQHLLLMELEESGYLKPL